MEAEDSVQSVGPLAVSNGAPPHPPSSPCASGALHLLCQSYHTASIWLQPLCSMSGTSILISPVCSSVSPTSPDTPRRTSYQPFQCAVCHSRFTRQENLRRHAALHRRDSANDSSISCEVCHARFARTDLRYRHMKRKHPDWPNEQTQAAKQQQQQQPLPQEGSRKIDSRPSDIGVSSSASPPLASPDDGFRHNTSASTTGDSTAQTNFTNSWETLGNSYLASVSELQFSPATANQLINDLGLDRHSAAARSPSNDSLPTDDWFPSDTQITRGCCLFFTYISPWVPIIHQPTFSPSATANSLLLSVLSLAYQHGEDPERAGEDESGAALSHRCFHRARALIINDERMDGDELPPQYHFSLVQTYLLLQTCAMMYMCGDASKYGLWMHSRMIIAARACRLVHPAEDTPVGPADDLNLLWQRFVKSETEKRTLFAAHQIDTLWYQLLSMPRQFSHLEIKHELPCAEAFWTAASSTEWAHRKLVAQNPGTRPMQYAEVVRRLVSSDGEINSIPEFDPYGTVNITHFLASSAREVSGWCAMTGIIGTERIEPLRSSLFSLSTLIHSQRRQPSPCSGSLHAGSALSEATWESAMLGMQLWSPSHTSGIISRSMNDVLQQLSHFSYTSEFLCEPTMALNIQPHVDWFLRYLDSTDMVTAAEAPWITLYAYNAFIIALNLVRGGVESAMQVVGVYNTQEALSWAKEVFGRRKQWRLGRLAMECLDTLS